jgi:small subunit ribosomal protein S16
MLTIRLSRVGKKKQPIYRFIVSEKARDPWGKATEILGQYNPRSTPVLFQIDEERVKYWISKGAQLSDTVHNLLVERKIITAEKRQQIKISKRRKEKLDKKKAQA